MMNSLTRSDKRHFTPSGSIFQIPERHLALTALYVSKEVHCSRQSTHSLHGHSLSEPSRALQAFESDILFRHFKSFVPELN